VSGQCRNRRRTDRDQHQRRDDDRSGDGGAIVLEALEGQFSLLRMLSVAGIPRAYDLIPGDRTCLVLEDRGLTPLSSVLAGGRLELPSVLALAIKLCTILDQIHSRDDLNYLFTEMLGNLTVGHMYANYLH